MEELPTEEKTADELAAEISARKKIEADRVAAEFLAEQKRLAQEVAEQKRKREEEQRIIQEKARQKRLQQEARQDFIKKQQSKTATKDDKAYIIQACEYGDDDMDYFIEMVEEWECHAVLSEPLDYSDGWTILTYLFKGAHIDCIKYLYDKWNHPLDSEADVKARLALFTYKDDIGNTPLQYATIANSLECVQFLVETVKLSAADKNMQNEDGFNALIWAAYFDFMDIARYLLGSGGLKLQLATKGGKNAISVAISRGHIDLADMLSP